MEVDLSACLEVAIMLARQAGALQAQSTQGKVSVVSKGGIDLVTDVDKRCEEIIFQGLKAKFPKHRFIGEESAPDVQLNHEPTWCVDPVDGTTNFIHKFPFYCVSIGLCIGQEPVMGVIFDPSRGDLYHAIKGGGAFVNGQPIHVDTNATSLDKAVVCTNFGHSRDTTIIQCGIDSVHSLLSRNVRGIRMTGSCCLAMAHVARGWASCYYESDIGGLWDVAAGTVIVLEAGGVVRHPDSGMDAIPLKKGKQKISCGNDTIVKIVLQAHKQIALLRNESDALAERLDHR